MKNWIYTIFLFSMLGCKEVTEPTVAIPKANFSIYNENCKAPCEVTFTNLTNGSFETKYKWEFGDGDTSRAISPRHLYWESGKYVVRLTATNKSGETIFEKFTTVQQDIPLSSFGRCRVERVILKKYPTYKPDGSRWDDVNTVDSLPDFIWILKDMTQTELYRSDDLQPGVNLDQRQLPYGLLRSARFRSMRDFSAIYNLAIADDDITTYDTMTEIKFRPIDHFPQAGGTFSDSETRSSFTIMQNGVEFEVLLIWI
jgi:PKD repeat protein